MADYNIYLHNVGGDSSGLSNKTTPFANQSESPVESFSGNTKNFINQAQQFSNNGFSNIVQQGVAALSKVVPWVAVVVLAAKITDKVLTTIGDTQATYFGETQFKMGWNNVKTIMSNVINPFGYAKSIIQQNLENRKQNFQTQATNMLVGNSLINTTNRGI